MIGHFEINREVSLARTGRLFLHHGNVETPAFMPVGTLGAVKTLSSDELQKIGFEMILGNTYHLYLRPGLEVLEKMGGLHSFMNWNRPILTDSGGFQVFSLGKLKKVTDEGVLFQSHLNGDSIFLSPELSAKIQQSIGSDIAMVLDECISLPNSVDVVHRAVIRSAEWAERFLKVPRLPFQKIFGIVQGGTSLELRELSLKLTIDKPIDGVAIGGLSVGEGHEEMLKIIDFVAPLLPKDLPHYLMGVGTPLDILEAVKRGIDLFDCVLPTRNARNGGVFTDDGLLNLRNQKYQFDELPISTHCLCFSCRHYSRAYLRHLFQIKEILGCRLATIHNLYYYQNLLREIRESIRDLTFDKFYDAKVKRLRLAYLTTSTNDRFDHHERPQGFHHSNPPQMN